MTNHSGKPPTITLASSKKMSPGQKSYEERRANQAGQTLEQWIDVNAREKRAAEKQAAYVPKRPGWFKRLMARIGQRLDRG